MQNDPLKEYTGRDTYIFPVDIAIELATDVVEYICRNFKDKWDWQWDTEGNREKFEDHRIKSDKYTWATKFVIGGIVLNHIISAIDALYLQNISLNEKVAVHTDSDPKMQSVQYSFSLSLK